MELVKELGVTTLRYLGSNEFNLGGNEFMEAVSLDIRKTSGWMRTS